MININSQKEFDQLGSHVEDSLTINVPIDEKKLKKISGSLIVAAPFTTNLEEVLGGVEVYANFRAAKLKQVGSLITFAYCYVPKLKEISDKLTVGVSFKARSLECIGNLAVHDEFRAPKLKRVEGGIFSEAPFIAKNLETLYVHPFSRALPMEYQNGEYYFCEEYDIALLIPILKLRHSSFQNFYLREFKREWGASPILDGLVQRIKEGWDSYLKLEIDRIFRLQDWNLRRFCFNYVQPSDIMKKFNAQRVSVAGRQMNYFRYENLKKVPFTKHNIYEVYKVDASNWSSRSSEQAFAVKVWCSSTDHEHWLWIDSEHKDDPLAAIASTFIFHENVIPHIKRLKRQGDIMLCEMKKKVIPEGEERPLTAKEYFSLLECET